MKYLKILGLAAVAAMAMSAFAAGSASATTLEVNGAAVNKSVAITASLESGVSATLSLTDGSLANTCTTSHVAGATEGTFTVAGTGKLSGAISTLTFENCTRPVAVHKKGTLSVSWISGTTNGTVFSSGAEVTVGSPIGTLTCTTPAAGTDIGTLTGATNKTTNLTKFATMDINGTINCGFLAPSTSWKGAYTVTSPEELAVRE